MNLQDLIENSLVMIKEKALKNSIQLSVDIDGIPRHIQADERGIKQIMYNLLSNAAKFTPAGGRISVKARKCDSKNSKGPDSEPNLPSGIQISVSDNGIGIDPADTKRIFNPFEQVESSASRRYQGTGLGLSLSKSLVELHGGKIWVESPGSGKGSTFHFVIPA